jgi:hypothetical protein
VYVQYANILYVFFLMFLRTVSFFLQA